MSSQTTEDSYDISAIMQGSEADSGVPYGGELLRFAEAVVARDAEVINSTREALAAAAGRYAVVDAAGVIANFHRMTRIADATGIVLDERMRQASVDLRAELAIDRFARAQRS